MFNSNEIFQKRATCTNYENISYSFDVNAEVYPCHFIPELYSKTEYTLNASTIAKLNEILRKKSYFEILNNEEKYNFMKRNTSNKVCQECEYNYICAIEKIHDLKDICIFNVFQLKHNLIALKASDKDYFCKEKYLYDIVFDFINRKGVNFLDNFS